MNKKELIMVNAFALLLILTAANYTLKIFSRGSFDILKKRVEAEVSHQVAQADAGASKNASNENLDGCSKNQPLSITVGNDQNLKQLAAYQELCKSFATDKLMIFTSFPFDEKSAMEDSTYMANKIKNLRENNITPIVVAEPYIGDKLMSYKDFLAGKYDNALDLYFQNIKKSGITDQEMGVWVPFPESNTPSWNNKDTEPRDFALCVNKYLGIYKKYFPQAKGSILLNALTFDPTDTAWNNGDYLNFTPYLQDIDKRLVNSFGIQGFPWISNAKSQRREIFRASEFLQPDLAISAAQELHTRDIWINTGTFSAKYLSDPELTRYISTSDRKGILDGILNVAKGIQDYQLNEYRVSINLFAEDKSQVEEATNWSYFQSDDSKTILKNFLKKAETSQVPISLFDIAHSAK